MNKLNIQIYSNFKERIHKVHLATFKHRFKHKYLTRKQELYCTALGSTVQDSRLQNAA